MNGFRHYVAHLTIFALAAGALTLGACAKITIPSQMAAQARGISGPAMASVSSESGNRPTTPAPQPVDQEPATVHRPVVDRQPAHPPAATPAHAATPNPQPPVGQQPIVQWPVIQQPVAHHPVAQHPEHPAGHHPVTTPGEHGEVDRHLLNSFHRAALWSEIEDSKPWTKAAVIVITERLPELDLAQDASQYCPGYRRASKYHRVVCWLRIVGGIANYESSLNPHERPFLEPDGTYSVGLLAISPGRCRTAPTARELFNPALNLDCGIHLMAKLVARDGYITGPPGSRGAASYWSTLREPYVRGRYHLGYKYKIMRFTRKYMKY